MMATVEIIAGDALTELRKLPEESVQCCVTSPPYWGLRDYGVAGQLGLEKTPEEYVANMVEVFREVRRVLKSDGTCWVNMGDCYNGSGNPSGCRTKRCDGGQETVHINSDNLAFRGNGIKIQGLKPKDLCGIPWRVAFALQADGWWLRQDIIWHKPNPMPESVTDRCTKAHEYIFLLTKSARYFFDAEAIKDPVTGNAHRGRKDGELSPRYGKEEMSGFNQRAGTWECTYLPAARNKRSVWTTTTEGYSEAHFATFPPDLIKPCILAGTSARGCCPKCGAPWERVVETDNPSKGANIGLDMTGGAARTGNPQTSVGLHRNNGGVYSSAKTTGWQPTCDCFNNAENVSPIPCTVLDPFAGSGTTGMVALELGRKAILIELNPAYIKLAQKRCHVTPGLAL